LNKLREPSGAAPGQGGRRRRHPAQAAPSFKKKPSRLNEAIVEALNERRIGHIVNIELMRVNADSHAEPLIEALLADVARVETRIKEIGGEFEPYDYPGSVVTDELIRKRERVN